MEIELAGERVWLDPDRALVWKNALVIADPHFGKDASARARAIPIPHGTTGADLARLDALIARHVPSELWLLGDVFDSADAAEKETLAKLVDWRRRHAAVAVRMVAGNHDRRALHLADAAGLELLPDLAAIGPWGLAHHPVETSPGHVLCGHVHPALRLKGPARDTLRRPAFIVGSRRTILPAFGGMTGSVDWRLSNDESGYLCAENRTIGPVHTSKGYN